ncbi:MAG: 16S rRNA (cytosine(1402)-N(4))-methyltransferase RsmH [Propionibacteriaceae bacterium]|jgi:16S rRNA (cytosine1402-N4)-methyltransferase|nr:16S rRNA (cytosine(1402)-N(4))-methyltransferase RsmH [Propionibacteriaceae bacterium]
MTATAAARHEPVLRERVVGLLAPALTRPGALFVDATVGLGGHAEAVLDRCPEARLLGIDRDPEALALAAARLAAFGGRAEFAQARYDALPRLLADRSLGRADAVLFDLGLSSLQIDDPVRGFAYAQDAPLDMRMGGPDGGLTAADIVNSYPVEKLARIFRLYGDERCADRIAAAVAAAREETPFTSSARLVAVIEAALPAARRFAGGGHPAKRVFQALRIEVNDEAAALAAALPAALAALRVGGRIAVLSYHSGEDRIVKRSLAAASRDRVPPGLVEVPTALAAAFRLLAAGAERPGPDETAANPRSASARLRAAERIQEGNVR